MEVYYGPIRDCVQRPLYLAISAFVHMAWTSVGGMEVFTRENIFFFVCFALASNLKAVLLCGPWMFDKRLVITKRWNPSISKERDLLASIPT